MAVSVGDKKGGISVGILPLTEKMLNMDISMTVNPIQNKVNPIVRLFSTSVTLVCGQKAPFMTLL